MLDYRVRTFLTVCEEGSYTKAADVLHVTQPAVTQHIHFLEDYYGTKLILTDGRKLRLTPEAETLKTALAAFENDEKHLIDILRRRDGSKKALSFGVTVTIGEFVIARPLSAFLKSHDNYDIRIVITNTKVLLDKLRSGEIQIALVEGYFQRKEFDSDVYRADRFIPVASVRYPFRRKPSRLRDLFQERLLVREPGSGTREILEKSLGARGFRMSDFTSQTEINSIYTIIQFLKESIGISFLYESAVREEINAGSLCEIPLEDFSMFHDFSFLWNRGSIFSGEYRRFCEGLKQIQSTSL